MRRHLVLIGLPGAGKSAVGQLAARALGCSFCDLDSRVAAAAGLSIVDLFTRRGEHAFREAEREEFARAVAEPPQVIAAGGGWAAQPGNLEQAHGRAVTVHLMCAPETAAGRLAGTSDRPLLAGDMIGRLRRLASARALSYERADAAVDTEDRTLDQVADAVVALARSVGGW